MCKRFCSPPRPPFPPHFKQVSLSLTHTYSVYVGIYNLRYYLVVCVTEGGNPDSLNYVWRALGGNGVPDSSCNFDPVPTGQTIVPGPGGRR
jgi:hypothetical protein